jgi:ferredoxin-nitrite reductase
MPDRLVRPSADVLEEIGAAVSGGRGRVSPGDADRLRWIGALLRRRAPGGFQMSIRGHGGCVSSHQLRTLADVSDRLGNGRARVTARQQIQISGLRVESVAQVLKELRAVDLSSLKTGLDRVSGVNTCSLAGLYAEEAFDASPQAEELTRIFLMHPEHSGLARKLSIAITGCPDHCSAPLFQDIALVPAVRGSGRAEQIGFNLSAGGQAGPGEPRLAKPLDVFVPPEEAAELCLQAALVFEEHGFRSERPRRPALLLDAWTPAKFRDALERRWTAQGRDRLKSAGTDWTAGVSADHLGPVALKRNGLLSVGLSIPAGRADAGQLRELSRLAEVYGSGEVRFTPRQNALLVGVPPSKLKALLKEPLLERFHPRPMNRVFMVPASEKSRD